MPRVIQFEIHAVDPARAVYFHRAVFGWKSGKRGGPQDYRLVITGSGGKSVVPKMAIPGVDWLACRKDTRVNISGMMQADARAG